MADKKHIDDYHRHFFADGKEVPWENVDKNIDYSNSFVKDKYIKTNVGIGNVVDYSDIHLSYGWSYIILDVTPGDLLELHVKGGDAPRTWAFTDKDDKVISSSEASVIFNNTLTVPSNAVKCVVHNLTTTVTNPKAILHTKSSRLYADGKEVAVAYQDGKVVYAKHRDNLCYGIEARNASSENFTTTVSGSRCKVNFKAISIVQPFLNLLSETDFRTGDKVVVSFDITDTDIPANANARFSFYNNFEEGVPFHGVGHYVMSFTNVIDHDDLHALRFITDTAGNMYMCNFKIEKNIVDTHYSIDPSVENNLVKIGKHYYPTVKIGNLIWLAENLNEDIGGGTWEGYYDNDPSYGVKGYGKLYTWDCVCKENETPSDALAAILPSGWRVPTKTDFDSLVSTIGAANYAKVKEKWYWETAGTNDSGFSAVGCGFKTASDFNAINSKSFYWSSSRANPELSACGFGITNNANMQTYGQAELGKANAFSIRLCMDAPNTLSAPPPNPSSDDE